MTQGFVWFHNSNDNPSIPVSSTSASLAGRHPPALVA